MKKNIVLLLLLSAILNGINAQAIYNNDAYIKSGPGSCWVVDNDGFTLTSTSATNLAQFDKLTIMGDASLTIGTSATPSYLTVNNTLTVNNDGGMTLESGSSLITMGDITNSGTITLKKTMSGDNNWHLLSGTVNATISSGTPALNWAPGENDSFFAWDEPDPGTWVNYKVTSGDLYFAQATVNNGNNFNPGKGYLLSYQNASVEKSFVGTPNTANVTFTLANSGSKGNDGWTYYSGWNLLGNPYPSAIDWHEVDHSGTSLFQDVYAYIYDDGTDDYIEISGNSSGAYIAPNQGFFVKTKVSSNGSQFTFANDMRAHGGNFYKKNRDDDSQLIIQLEGNNYSTNTKLQQESESSTNRDRLDALKLFSYNPDKPQLFTISADNVWLAINSMPQLNEFNPVAMGLKLPVDGVYELSISNIPPQLFGTPLYIEDTKSGNWQRVDNNSLSFTELAGDVNDRFILHPGAVGINETVDQSNPVKVYTDGKTISIINNNNISGKIMVVNIIGQKTSSYNLNGDNTQKLTLNIPMGVYVVHIKTDQGNVYSEKIIIRR